MSNELQHYGVPGMKWGVRKERYKSLGKKQKKVLRAYGTYYSNRAMALRLKDKQNKLSEPKQKKLKELEKYKSNIEKVLKLKIDDVSSGHSGRIEQFMTSGLIPSLIAGASLGKSLNAITKGKDALQKYLES